MCIWYNGMMRDSVKNRFLRTNMWNILLPWILSRQWKELWAMGVWACGWRQALDFVERFQIMNTFLGRADVERHVIRRRSIFAQIKPVFVPHHCKPFIRIITHKIVIIIMYVYIHIWTIFLWLFLQQNKCFVCLFYFSGCVCFYSEFASLGICMHPWYVRCWYLCVCVRVLYKCVISCKHGWI